MRYRGFNCGGVRDKRAADFAAAKAIGANSVRLFVDGAPVEDVLAGVERARAAGLEVILTLNMVDTDLIKTWKPIVGACRGRVAGWDIANEPQNNDWRHIARRTFDWLQVQDKNAEVIVETDARTPMEPLGFGRHSFHFYEPMAITHQATGPWFQERWTYPTGTDPVTQWNRGRLRAMLGGLCLPGCLVGEFSCARNTPGRTTVNWMTDVLAILDEHQADWMYQDFRGDPCWDAELPEGLSIGELRSARRPARGQTETLTLLQAAMSKGR